MRMPRTVIAVLAFCLIGLVPFATSSSATATEVAAKASDSTVASALPTRTVKFEFKATSRTRYKFFGKVQAATNKKILLMRSQTKRGTYRAFKSTRTNDRGNYKFLGLRATGWFYVKVPADARFKTSYSQLIRVYYH
ncbi:MAG: hypothetical protein M3237_16190 [Actinomycetota bacterium]|nr:hypothetical protein [Actinomycetota bacterium]